ncbi:MAG: hypothetical protein ACFFBS_06280 [Promethearchaeota archaeon]
MPVVSSKKICTPTCKFFKCAQHAITIREGRREEQTIACRFIPGEDLCQGPKCNFAYCVKRKLRPDLTCGLSLPKEKPLHVEKKEEWRKPIPIKGKVLKRIKEEDLYY